MSDQTISERWAAMATVDGDEHLVTPLAGDVGFIFAIKRGELHTAVQVLDTPDDAKLEEVRETLLASL